MHENLTGNLTLGLVLEYLLSVKKEALCLISDQSLPDYNWSNMHLWNNLE